MSLRKPRLTMPNNGLLRDTAGAASRFGGNTCGHSRTGRSWSLPSPLLVAGVARSRGANPRQTAAARLPMREWKTLEIALGMTTSGPGEVLLCQDDP